MLSDRCPVLSVLSVTFVHYGQTVGWIKMKRGRGPGHIVLDGDPAPPPTKGHRSPIFGLYLLRPNGWMDHDGTWQGGRPQPRRLRVRWGPSTPPPKGGGAPQFSAHFHCGQLPAGFIKLPLGMKVGLSPGDFVLDGYPAPTPKWVEPHSIFGPRLLCQTAAWIKVPLGTEVGFGLCYTVFDVDPATPRKKGTPTPSNFWPMSIVAKWLDG